MDKFLIKRKRVVEQSCSQPEVQSSPNVGSINVQVRSSTQPEGQSSKVVGSNEEEVNLDELEFDPGLRRNIYDYDPKRIENVRRAYLQKGPCQPKTHSFPQTLFVNVKRRFNPKWFDEHARWLEYSIKEDAAFCLCCYLFKSKQASKGSGQSGGESFVINGFRNWKKKERLNEHVGGPMSSHNQCLRACDDLMNQKQHIEVCLSDHSEQARLDYRVRLTASFDCLKFLLRQGLAFRGHDESSGSNNLGNFLELMVWLSEHNDSINEVVLKNAPENHKMTSPDIQKDLINAAASVTTKVIMEEIGNGLFSILVDESRDISVKEQMAVALRYVDKKGCVIERFIGIVHVRDTSALSLKAAIDSFFSKHGLSMSSVRGQGYDGASNMRGEFNGLKTLILKENTSAFYVHCFAHQLQLTVVTVAKKHNRLSSFFNHVEILSNIVGASCKRRDVLREKQFEKIIEGIYSGELETGTGLNQELGVKRAGDTRWGSHHGTICSLINLFSSVLDVLEVIEEDGACDGQRGQANDLKRLLQSFEFLIILHSSCLMKP